MPNSPPTHKPPRTGRSRRSTKQRHPFYGSYRWRQFRDWFIRTHPLCADPFGHHAEDGRIVAANHVDHVIPRREQPEERHMREDLCQALCQSCHSRKTALGE